ncbi:MAG: nuclear transport factor 2 family protein [Hyphomonadaceae bacterium]
MNQDIHTALRRYADAWLSGDLVRILACYHDEFTLHYGGANPLTGDHAGKAAALGALAEVTRRANRQLLEIVDVLAGETRGALIARERFTRDGRSDEFVRTLVFTVRDGLLSECIPYDQDQPLIDWYLRD